MTPPGRFGRWEGFAREAAGSLLLVLVLFWLFMIFLWAIFPSGTPLKELVQSGMETGPARGAGERTPEATLTSLVRDVRFRRGNAVEWGGASAGMNLYSRDAVQTFDRSGARISFAPRDELSVGSNSLVVVTRLNGEDESGPRSYRVQVEGEVSGSISAARKLRLEIAAAGHLAQIMPGRARFRLTRSGDSGESLAVYAGEAQVVSGKGVVRVPANYGVSLVPGVPVRSAVALPAPPRLELEQAHYRFRLLPPRVSFAWSGAAPGYRFQLSRDEGFKRCLFDEKLSGPGFTTGKLEAGSYYWRVCGVRDGMEGGFSRVGRCRLEQLLKPPELKVEFPQQNAATGPYLLTGSLEPGARLYVNGAELQSDGSGRFQQELQLRPGVNLIRVEAFDSSGNASYASRIVYGRPGGATPSGATPGGEAPGP